MVILREFPDKRALFGLVIQGPLVSSSTVTFAKLCNKNWMVATQIFFVFSPQTLGKMIHFDEHFFSDGLVQPSSRKDMCSVGEQYTNSKDCRH